MSVVLLDTNIVSYLFKRDTRAALYAPHVQGQELAISVMTVAELFQWAEMRSWGQARTAELERHLDRYTILPVDIPACRKWAFVRSHRSTKGLPISPQDAWVAATALRYELPLVTHNKDDFQEIPGLTIISEG